MSHTISLEPSDMDPLDEEFDSIQAELDMFNDVHGGGVKVIHEGEEMELIANVITKDEMIIKEEDGGTEIIIEKMEDVEDVDMNEDMNEMMHNVIELQRDEAVTMESEDDALFTEGVIGEEEIINDGEVMSDSSVCDLHITDDDEREYFDDMMNEVTRETIIEPGDVEDRTQIGEVITADEEPEVDMSPSVSVDDACTSYSSGMFVVSSAGLTSTSNVQQTIFPKDQKVTRLVTLPEGGQQTIRIMNAQGKPIQGATTKAITLAQARQMGLIPPGVRVNTILPAGSGKGGSNKLVVPLSKKTLTMVKPPTKILPAPTPQTLATKTVTVPSSTPGGLPTKVIIRHGLRPGTILTQPSGSATGGTQMIRIPTSQVQSQIAFSPNSKPQQVQYLKFVTPGSKQSTLVPVSLAKPIQVPVGLPTTLLNSSTAFKMVPIGGATSTASNAQRVLIPASAVVPTSSASGQQNLNSIVMLPSHILQQKEQLASSIPSSGTVTVMAGSPKTKIAGSMTTNVVAATPISTSTTPPVPIAVQIKAEPKIEQYPSGDEGILEANGIRPRKACNCTKSMCLKLYCDCFANGEFCNQCNCLCCYNNLEHEEERQRAIKSCLERNPTAFRPKIGKTLAGSEERRHNRGCNCKRSGCLKNYCECYEAKIPCSKNCKCVSCKNTDWPGRKNGDDSDMRKSDASRALLELQKSGHRYGDVCRQAFNMMTPEVVRATCQCLIAQAENWSDDKSQEAQDIVNQAQALILEEFGRCVGQVIECVTKSIPHQNPPPVQTTS